MNNQYLALSISLIFLLFLGLAGATSPIQVVLTTTSGTTWTVPANYVASGSAINVIGGGGGGGSEISGGKAGYGGGGGGSSSISNLVLKPGATVTFAIGAGGNAVSTSNGLAGGDTYICNSIVSCGSISDANVVVGAKGGGGGGSNPYSAGAGGSSGSGVGLVLHSGGAGGNHDTGNYNGGGGGGAGGPKGTGSTGGNSAAPVDGAPGGSGGSGDAGAGGATVSGSANAAGNPGNPGTEWGSYGSGSGGAGGSANTHNGGNGGNYGGGGGASSGDNSAGTTGMGGSGANGIIIITYTPLIMLPASNSVADVGQYETLTGALGSDVSNPFTYNYIISNSVTNTVVYSLPVSNSLTSNTLLLQIPAYFASNSPLQYNVIITDALSATTNTVYSSPFTVNPAFQANTLTESNTVIKAGLNSVLTGGQAGGTTPYGTINWFSQAACGGTPIGTGTSISVSPLVTTTYSFNTVDSATANNILCSSNTVTVVPPVITINPPTPAQGVWLPSLGMTINSIITNTFTRSYSFVSSGQTLAWYQMNGQAPSNSFLQYDASGNGNNALCGAAVSSVCPTYSAGPPFGYGSYSFDGSTQYFIGNAINRGWQT
jgi:hypothetical protein